MKKKPLIISPRQAAFQAITRIERDHAFSDIVLNHLLKQRENDRNNALISELVRGTVRWKKQLAWIVNSFLDKPDHLPQEIHWLLWLGAFQILHMNTPDFAAVNETVELSKGKHGKWTRLVNGVLRSIIRNKDSIVYPDRDKDPVAFIAVSQSHPEWLVERWLEQFGYETTLELCRANNKIPTVTVRLNKMRLSVEEFEEMLIAAKFQYKNGTLPDYYRLQNMNISKFQEWLSSGYISVQDESAGLVAMICCPKSGDIVFDLCAAPGGKAAHLAELSDDKATILAGEINPARAGLIKQTANRLNLHHLYTLAADGHNFPANQADLVLLDAPCSGLGVLRKKPDMRWNRELQDLDELNTLQQNLLNRAAQNVRPGGFLVYSTCTIERRENEDIVKNFLNANHFELIKPDMNTIGDEFMTHEGFIRTWPHIHEMDGSFVVKLKKKDTN